LVFKDFTVNETIDPEKVGIFAMGVTPWAEDLHSGDAEPFFIWAGAIHIDKVGANGTRASTFPSTHLGAGQGSLHSQHRWRDDRALGRALQGVRGWK